MNASILEWLLWGFTISSGAVLLAWGVTIFFHTASAAWKHFIWLLALIVPLVVLPFLIANVRVDLPVLPGTKEKIESGVEATARQPLQNPESKVIAIKSGHSLSSVVSVPFLLWAGVALVILVRLAVAHVRLGRILGRAHCLNAGHPVLQALSEMELRCN